MEVNVVVKVGGASIRDVLSIKTFLSRVQQYMKEPTIVVVSAMDKVTNMLEFLALCLYEGKQLEAKKAWHEVYDFHMNIVRELFSVEYYREISNEIGKLFIFDIDKYKNKPYDSIYGKIVPLGELASSVIVNCYLDCKGLKNKLVDARDFMVTSENSIDAEVLFSETRRAMKTVFTESFIQENPLIITQGFIGKTPNGFSSTIGREGSDYTAALLGLMPRVNCRKFWKKRGVEGNPPKISFEQFEEIENNSDKGKLLSSKAFQLLKENGKSFEIINFDNLDERTIVS